MPPDPKEKIKQWKRTCHYTTGCAMIVETNMPLHRRLRKNTANYDRLQVVIIRKYLAVSGKVEHDSTFWQMVVTWVLTLAYQLKLTKLSLREELRLSHLKSFQTLKKLINMCCCKFGPFFFFISFRRVDFSRYFHLLCFISLLFDLFILFIFCLILKLSFVRILISFLFIYKNWYLLSFHRIL